MKQENIFSKSYRVYPWSIHVSFNSYLAKI